MIGTCTIPKVRTRPTELQNGPLANTCWYWVSPPKTSRAAPNVPSRSTVSSDSQTA